MQRTSDAAVADYLVPRTGERIRYTRLTDDGQVEEFKRAIDITLIDPACGTMHFGQYAFGLFHRMYLDEIEHAQRSAVGMQQSADQANRGGLTGAVRADQAEHLAARHLEREAVQRAARAV